jgi:hypothetical protein
LDEDRTGHALARLLLDVGLLPAVMIVTIRSGGTYP